MTENRFTIIQNGDNFTVRDNLKNRPMGMFEFKEDEFPVYFCFHKIIDLLNELNDEIVQLKSINQDHKDHLADFYADYDRLEKENEQLKMHMKSAKAHLEGGHTKKAIERLKIIDIR